MKIYTIAAIDIGSNAIRLLVSHVIEEKAEVQFRKYALVRVPLRLGRDVFLHGEIGKNKRERLIAACIAYKQLLKAYEVDCFRACATSAMREAGNAAQVLDEIRNASGLDVEVISGQEEASIIYSTHIERLLEKDRASMYVDIGGGSTEITLFKGQNAVASQSFNIGTVRMLEGKVKAGAMDGMKAWLQQHCRTMKGIQTIGSGGTINKLSKLASGRKKEGIFHSYAQLKQVYQQLREMSMEERIWTAGLNRDRADVILPAAQIMLSVMKWSGSKAIMIPRFGLADGMIRKLYEEKPAEKTTA